MLVASRLNSPTSSWKRWIYNIYIYIHTFNLVKIKRVDSLNFASRFIRWKFSRQREWNEEQSRAGNGESKEEMGEANDWGTRHESKDDFRNLTRKISIEKCNFAKL